MREEANQKHFLESVSGHVMKIHRDDGLYRHVEFRNPLHGNYRFELTTWPGHLCITGDIGDFVFTRVDNMKPKASGVSDTMFSLFRSKDFYRTDYSYWATKCVAGKTHEFDPESLIEAVNEAAAEWAEDHWKGRKEFREGDKKEFFQCVEEMTDEIKYGGEDESYRMVMDFEWDGCEPFAYMELNGYERPTETFLSCCNAIRWGIGVYDAELNAQTLSSLDFSSFIATT